VHQHFINYNHHWNPQSRFQILFKLFHNSTTLRTRISNDVYLSSTLSLPNLLFLTFLWLNLFQIIKHSSSQNHDHQLHRSQSGHFRGSTEFKYIISLFHFNLPGCVKKNVLQKAIVIRDSKSQETKQESANIQ
jgi:hypothetical protein